MSAISEAPCDLLVWEARPGLLVALRDRAASVRDLRTARATGWSGVVERRGVVVLAAMPREGGDPSEAPFPADVLEDALLAHRPRRTLLLGPATSARVAGEGEVVLLTGVRSTSGLTPLSCWSELAESPPLRACVASSESGGSDVTALWLSAALGALAARGLAPAMAAALFVALPDEAPVARRLGRAIASLWRRPSDAARWAGDYARRVERADRTAEGIAALLRALG